MAAHERLHPKTAAVIAEYHDFADGAHAGEAPGEPMYPVGPDTGALLHILAACLDRPVILEIGTSFGYSTLWLADAARQAGGRVVSLELHEHKARFAERMLRRAELSPFVELRVGDAVGAIGDLETAIDFVLLDLWKELYVPCLHAFMPKLADGAIVVADNMIVPGGGDVRRYRDVVKGMRDLDSILLPVGSGLEVSRFRAAGADRGGRR